MADSDQKARGHFGYRLMLWEYALQDRLHIDPPEPHLAKVSITPGMTVVDWGCGPGRFVVPVARMVGDAGRVYAIDIQPLAIEAVRRRAAKAGLRNVTPLLIDSYTAPLETGVADVVLLLDAFHGIGNRSALLKEIRRVLKPGGLLFMDPGHMPLVKTVEAIEGTGLFRIAKTDGKHMTLKPV
ncbi:MAG: class I SAM-dependent methyltransferase [Anaerolineae bacterium]